MKKLLLFTATMLFAVSSVFAQSDSKVKKQTTTNYKNGKTVEVTVYENGDKKTVIYENDSVKIGNKRFKRSQLRQQLPKLYFNYLHLSEGAFAPISSAIPQRPVSFEWGMYFPMSVFSVGNTTMFGMATGLGFSNSYNQFNTKWVVALSDQGNMKMKTLNEHTDGRFDESNKSYLRYWSIRLPLTLQLQWRVGKNPLSVSAGAEVEWRFGMRSFAKYDGAKRTICDKVNYKPFGCNALFQVGYAGVILFAKMGLTDMFGSLELGGTYQFTAGIGLNFNND